MRRRDSNRFILVAGAVAGILASSSAFATTQIGLNPLVIQAAPGQHISIMGASSTGLSALDIFVQIGDGGTDNLGTNNSSNAPRITGIDLTTGVFAGNNGGNLVDQTNSPISPDGLLAAESVQTAGVGGVHTLAPFGASPLGMLTLDATGLAGDTFDVYFTNVAANTSTSQAPFFGESDSDYGFGGSQITFGSTDSGSGNYLGTSTPLSAPLVVSIVAVPEPATFSGLILLGSGLLLRRRARNRTK